MLRLRFRALAWKLETFVSSTYCTCPLHMVALRFTQVGSSPLRDCLRALLWQWCTSWSASSVQCTAGEWSPHWWRCLHMDRSSDYQRLRRVICTRKLLTIGFYLIGSKSEKQFSIRGKPYEQADSSAPSSWTLENLCSALQGFCCISSFPASCTHGAMPKMGRGNIKGGREQQRTAKEGKCVLHSGRQTVICSLVKPLCFVLILMVLI